MVAAATFNAIDFLGQWLLMRTNKPKKSNMLFSHDSAGS
jgi:hypothetical protein